MSEAEWEAKKGLRQLQRAIMGKPPEDEDDKKLEGMVDEVPVEVEMDESLLCQQCDMAVEDEEELDLSRFQEVPQGQDDWGYDEIEQFFGPEE